MSGPLVRLAMAVSVEAAVVIGPWWCAYQCSLSHSTLPSRAATRVSYSHQYLYVRVEVRGCGMPFSSS